MDKIGIAVRRVSGYTGWGFIIVLLFGLLNCQDSIKKDVDELAIQQIDSLIKECIDARKNDPRSIAILADSILNLSKKAEYMDGQLEGMYNLAVSSFFESKYEEARTQCDNILDKSSQAVNLDTLTYQKFVGSALILKGLTFQRTGDYQQAIQNYLEALKIFEQLDDQKNISVTYINLSECFRFIKDFQRALDYNLKAEELLKEAGNDLELNTVYQNRGNIFHDEGKFEGALEIFKTTLARSKQKNDLGNTVNALNNLGVSYEKLNQPDLAIPYYEQALRLYLEIEDKWGESNTLGNLSVIYLGKGDFTRAINFSQRGLKLAKESNSLELIQFHYENLANTYEAMGQYDESLETYKKAIEARDTLYGQEKFSVINELEQKYKEEKAERTIAQKDKEIINAKLQSRKRLFLIILLTLLVVLSLTAGIFIFRLNLGLQHKNEIISQKSEEILQQKDEIQGQKEDLELLVNAYEAQRKKTIQIGKNQILIDDIIYVKYSDRISHLFLKNGEILEHRVQLSQLASDLKFSSNFLFGQINQNYLVNFNNVDIRFHDGDEEKYFYTEYLPVDREEGRNEDYIKTRIRSGLTRNFEKEYSRYFRLKDLLS